MTRITAWRASRRRPRRTTTTRTSRSQRASRQKTRASRQQEQASRQQKRTSQRQLRAILRSPPRLRHRALRLLQKPVAICVTQLNRNSRGDDGPLGYGLLYTRAPPDKSKDKNDDEVCVSQEEDLAGGIDDLTISDGECTGGDLDLRSLDFSSLLGIAGLEKRSTTRKKLTINWSNGDSDDLDFGTYHPCRDAKGKAGIAQYYKIHHDPNTCSHSVEKVDSNKAFPTKKEGYQTEHVYEAQAVVRFLSWLAKGGAVKTGSAYTPAF